MFYLFIFCQLWFCFEAVPLLLSFPGLCLVESWTLTTEVCSNSDIALVSFVTFWMSRRQCIPAVTFCWLGKLVNAHHCSMFLIFVENVSDCGSLQYQSLKECVCNPFHTANCPHHCVSTGLEFHVHNFMLVSYFYIVEYLNADTMS